VGIKPQPQKRSTKAEHAGIKAAPAPVPDARQAPAVVAAVRRSVTGRSARRRRVSALPRPRARRLHASARPPEAGGGESRRAEAAEKQARAVWERAHDELLEARRKVMDSSQSAEHDYLTHLPTCPPAPPAHQNLDHLPYPTTCSTCPC
jgi:hypothetical protein